VRVILLASISLAAACGTSGNEPHAAPASASEAPAARPAAQAFADEQVYVVDWRHKTQTFHAPRAEVIDAGREPRATLRYALSDAVELELRAPDGSQKFFGAHVPLDDDHVVMMAIATTPDPKDGRARVMITDRGQVLTGVDVHGFGEPLFNVVQHTAVVLPDAAVGPGARWRIRRPWLLDGFELEEVTYTLRSRDGDRATIDVDGRTIGIDDHAVETATGNARRDAARAAVARLHGRAFEDLPHVSGLAAHTVEHATLDLRAPLAGAITVEQTTTTNGNAESTHAELIGELSVPPPD
jgi:hypothetical protein